MTRNKNTHSQGGFILILFLLLVFEFFSMQTIVLNTVSYFAQIAYLLAFIMAGVLLLSKGKVPNNFFLKLFVLWMIYIELRFITSTTGHNNSVAFFRYAWFCVCYIVVFLSGRKIENREKTFVSFAVLLVVIAFYYTYQNTKILTSGSFSFEEVKEASNTIFWSLCILPAAFLLNNRIWQLVWLSAETFFVMLTMKRSAVISMSLIMVLYAFMVFTKDKSVSIRAQRLTRVWTIILAIIVFLLLMPRMTVLIDNNRTRIESILEDGGSGRVLIWQDALKGIDNSSFVEILLGHGVASSMQTIGHTSAHNDFLTLLIEFGVVGMVFYIIFIIKIIKRVFKTYKHSRKAFYCYTCILIILLCVGNVGDLFTCYSYLGIIMATLAILELGCEQGYSES